MSHNEPTLAAKEIKMSPDTSVAMTIDSMTINTPSIKPIISCGPTQIASPNTSKTFGIKTAELTVFASVITTLISLVVAYKTIQKYSKDHEHQTKLLEINKRNDEVLRAKEKIEHFYGPCNALLEESSIIYSHFALKEKETLKVQGNSFRTLRYLTELNDESGAQRFANYDQKLLEQICTISSQVLKLIEEKSGYIDNPELHSLLGKLTAHYRILKLATSGELNGLHEELESIVFPIEINGAIDNEINKLQKIIKPNLLNAELKSNTTIKYYDDCYIEYHQKTHSIDMLAIYDEVRKWVANGSRILDAGCGTGRDTQYFLKNGFKVTSFDASLKMVELCNEYPFAYCEQKSFDTINYPSKFDLVWACASLLHLDKDELKRAFYKLFKSLKDGGILYFSLKSNSIDNSERQYYYYNQQEIDLILTDTLRMRFIKSWVTTSGLNSNEEFTNYLYKK